MKFFLTLIVLVTAFASMLSFAQETPSRDILECQAEAGNNIEMSSIQIFAKVTENRGDTDNLNLSQFYTVVTVSAHARSSMIYEGGEGTLSNSKKSIEAIIKIFGMDAKIVVRGNSGTLTVQNEMVKLEKCKNLASLLSGSN